VIRIFLNGLAANAGAGLTYLYNVVPRLACHPEVRTIVAVQPTLRKQFEQLAGVEVISPPNTLGTTRRFLFEQFELPRIIRESQAHVLISAGNFALRKSPVPQILLSGNSLYTSKEFRRDLAGRREYGMMAGNFMRGIVAKKSVAWAERTVAPSTAFAEELSAWTKKAVCAIHHGFDRQRFCSMSEQLPRGVQRKLNETADCYRLLFVSHYNYYRNFETLLRALPLITRTLAPKKVRLVLTCMLEPGKKPGGYDSTNAARLVEELGISESVVQLGPVPYDALYQVYRACDLYVTAAYAETFAHPLVEAMSSGLPIVAADRRVHREVCGDAALYFETFEAESLADTVARVATSSETRAKLDSAGSLRVQSFTWAEHVEKIVSVATDLCAGLIPFVHKGKFATSDVHAVMT
jgi:glycosyltransferase involved in cell wall biosynthesis